MNRIEIENMIAETMAESWMGDEVDCADVGGILVEAVETAINQARLAGIAQAEAAFTGMWSSGDWEGQVSIGFASTFSQELDQCREL